MKISSSWLIFSEGFTKPRNRTVVKRAEDIILAVTMLVLLSSLLLITAILIKLDSRGPLLFAYSFGSTAKA